MSSDPFAITAPRTKRTRRRARRASPAIALRQLLWAPTAATAPPPTRRERLRLLTHGHLLPLGLYLLLALLATFPLILHFGSWLPSDGGDALQNYWNYWWTRQALAAGQNPYWTPLLYAPYGAPLYLHTLNLFNGLVSLPLQLLFGLIPAYNTIVLLSLSLAGYFAYLLVAEICGSRHAGFVGGVVYAFGSYHMIHLLGHMNLLASEWLPAYILCLHRASSATGRRRTIYILAALGALLLLMLCDWQYVLFAGLFTICYSPSQSVARRSLAPLVVAAAIGTLWLVVAAPLLLPTIAQARAGNTVAPTEAQVHRLSADLLDFISPTQLATLWQPLGQVFGADAFQPSDAGGTFLGFFPLLLASIALWHAPRRAWPWMALALLFMVLALGPVLTIAGVARGVSLPYALFAQIPLLNIARVPNRLSLIVTLCLAILAGLALVALSQRYGARIGTRPRIAFTAILTVLLLAEHLILPFPLEAVSAPPFYRQLATSPEQGTVLELPYCKQCSITNYRQTVHGRPVIGGYIARRLVYPIRDSPLFRELLPPGEDMTPGVEQAAIGRQILAYAGVHWIVVIRDDPDLDPDAIAKFVARFAEPTPIYEDAAMIVYRPAPAPGLDRFIAPVSGWQEVEQASDTSSRMRWFAEAGTVEAWNFSEAARDYTLRFDTASYRTPRRLEVLLDDQLIGQWQFDNAREITIPLVLTPGSHRFTFRSLDPPTRPNSIDPQSLDDRDLAIAVANLVLADR